MNLKCYKYCAVPLCENTTLKTPDKLFIQVPGSKALRKKWLELANFDRTDLSGEAAATLTNCNYRKHFCEDHFDLPRDMENYMQYCVMGAVCTIRMRPGCLPSKFECQGLTMSHATVQPASIEKTLKEFDKLVTNATARKRKKVYKSCMVPQCGNTTVTAPGKIFIRVPDKPRMRQKWFELARRHAATITITALHCCEDHFDLPNDMQNYMQYKLMGSVKTIRMVPGCLPSRFECQPDRRKRLAHRTIRPLALKRQRAALIKEAETSIHIASYVPKGKKETILDTSSDTSLVEVECDYSASDTDSPDPMQVREESERSECASETDVCATEPIEFVRVKEEIFEPEVKIEVEIGPEVLQPQDIYYTLNTSMRPESVCKLEPSDYEHSGDTAYVK